MTDLRYLEGIEIQVQYPLVDFSIMELIQLNDFVNHQLAHNVLFLSVESDAIEFVFAMLKDPRISWHTRLEVP